MLDWLTPVRCHFCKDDISASLQNVLMTAQHTSVHLDSSTLLEKWWPWQTAAGEDAEKASCLLACFDMAQI